MSKRLLVAFLALGILATSNAFASRARLLVMGTGDAAGTGFTDLAGNGGSLYYDDAYNVFYNPAYVNDFKNWGIIEKSNFPGTSAEGGFVTSLMNWNLGLFFNRTAGIKGTYASNANMRPIDIMIGSDMGVKWGIGATWASRDASGADNDTDSVLTLKAGVSVAEFEPFFHINVINNHYTAAGATAQKQKYIGAGLRYHWGEWAPYAAYTTQKVDTGPSNTNIGLGIGRTTSISEGARMVYSVSAWRLNNNQTGPGTHTTLVPIDFAVEGDAASWLTLRGGLNFALVNKPDNAASNGDATTARVGASIHVGKADVDWAIGTANPVAAQTEANAVAASGGVDSQVNGIAQGFFTAMSVAYKW